MKFVSTRKGIEASSAESVFQGLAPDGGLFVLEHGKDHRFDSHPSFVEHRAYGSVNFSFFRKTLDPQL